MHKLATNRHFLAVRTQIVAVVALLCVFLSTEHQLRAVGPPTRGSEQVGRLAYGAHHLLVRLDAVI